MSFVLARPGRSIQLTTIIIRLGTVVCAPFTAASAAAAAAAHVCCASIIRLTKHTHSSQTTHRAQHTHKKHTCTHEYLNNRALTELKVPHQQPQQVYHTVFGTRVTQRAYNAGHYSVKRLANSRAGFPCVSGMNIDVNRWTVCARSSQSTVTRGAQVQATHICYIDYYTITHSLCFLQ